MFSSLSARARLLLKISFMVTFAEAMLVPIYAAFAEKVGGSILDAGIAFAVFSMATGGAVALIGTRSWFQHHIRTLPDAGVRDVGGVRRLVHLREQQVASCSVRRSSRDLPPA